MQVSHADLKRALEAGDLKMIEAMMDVFARALDIAYESLARRTFRDYGMVLFCSARDFPGWEDVRDTLSRCFPRLVEAGLARVITGGGPYLMQHGNRLAARHGIDSVQVQIPLCSEEKNEADNFESLVLRAHSLDPRIMTMASMADAALVLPGGFGSLYELAAFLQRIQLQMAFGSLNGIPFYPRYYTGVDFQPKVVAVGEVWKQIRPLLRALAVQKTINWEDQGIVTFVDTIDQAIDILVPHIEERRKLVEKLQEAA